MCVYMSIYICVNIVCICICPLGGRPEVGPCFGTPGVVEERQARSGYFPPDPAFGGGSNQPKAMCRGGFGLPGGIYLLPRRTCRP